MAESDFIRGYSGEGWMQSIRRRVRLIVLLDAAEAAGLVPLPIQRLHNLAYLANVLAPVWDMPVLDGSILKRYGSPFYPSLQHDLDRLVGMGIVWMSGLGYSLDESKRWRLDGFYHLNRRSADPILEALGEFEEEVELQRFIQELAYALSALSDEELDQAMTEDATYSDPRIDFGNVVDFAEWRQVNYSANAANRFNRLLSDDTPVSWGEKIHFYVRHLRSRLHGGR